VLSPRSSICARPDIAARVSRCQVLDDWLARSPLVEIVFDDEWLPTSS
jgi:hypothetical protein